MCWDVHLQWTAMSSSCFSSSNSTTCQHMHPPEVYDAHMGVTCSCIVLPLVLSYNLLPTVCSDTFMPTAKDTQ